MDNESVMNVPESGFIFTNQLKQKYLLIYTPRPKKNNTSKNRNIYINKNYQGNLEMGKRK